MADIKKTKNNVLSNTVEMFAKAHPNATVDRVAALTKLHHEHIEKNKLKGNKTRAKKYRDRLVKQNVMDAQQMS